MEGIYTLSFDAVLREKGYTTSTNNRLYWEYRCSKPGQQNYFLTKTGVLLRGHLRCRAKPLHPDHFFSWMKEGFKLVSARAK